MSLQAVTNFLEGLWLIGGLISWIILVGGWKWLTPAIPAPATQCNSCGYPVPLELTCCTECGGDKTSAAVRFPIVALLLTPLIIALFIVEAAWATTRVEFFHGHSFSLVACMTPNGIMDSVTLAVALSLTLVYLRKWPHLVLPVILIQSFIGMSLNILDTQSALNNPPKGEVYAIDLVVAIGHIMRPIGTGLPLLIMLLYARWARKKMLNAHAPLAK